MLLEKGEKKRKKEKGEMKLRYGGPYLYLKIQKGRNIPIFRGVRRRGRFSFRFLRQLLGTISKSLLIVGKNVIIKAALDIMNMALEVGNDILHGKLVKNTAKGALRNASRSLARNTRQSIE